MPCSALFLLLLLLPPHIFKAGSLRYHGPGWKLFHRLGKGFRGYNQRQFQRMRQNWRHGRSGEDCQGVFNLYFILDKSGSVAENWKHIYSFTENLVKKFQNPRLQMSFITYSTNADIIMPLTSDREAIRNGLLTLQKLVPEGRIYMQKGFMKANEQMRNATLAGNNFNSVIIALTGGLLMIHTYKETLEEANKARRMGATIYTVGVHEYNKQQVTDIADSPNNSFEVDKGFPALQGIIDPLVSKSCTEALYVEPSNVCVQDSYQVSISGHGFDNTKSLSQILCRFTFNDSRIVDEAPNGKNKTTISCPGPKILHSGEEVSLEVSLNNGLSFIGNKLVITGISCRSTGEGALGGSRSGSIPSQLQQEDSGPVPANTRQDNPKQGNTRQDSPKQGNTRQDSPKQGNTRQDSPEQGNTRQDSPEQGNTRQDNPKQGNTRQDSPEQGNIRQDNPKQGNTRRVYIPLRGNTNINWILLLFLPVLLVVLLLLLCCYWKLRRKKPKKRPPPPPRPEKEIEEDLPPPSKSPPAPHTLPPPAPSSVNPNPTVIVACCGCGNRRVQGNLDTCYNYFQPSCHQMPVMWCHPKVQGRCANFTVVNPSCSQASCSPKICLGPNRNCYLTQAPGTSRIVLQPSGECFSIPQASCSPKICLGTSRDCVPVAQTLCSKMCPPNQKYYTINYSQTPCSSRCTSSPSRMLPLLTPHARQSLESLCHTYPDCPSSKRQKF